MKNKKNSEKLFDDEFDLDKTVQSIVDWHRKDIGNLLKRKKRHNQ